MKWKVTFLDGSPDEEIEADSWEAGFYGWIHFVREGNPDQQLVAAFHENILRSIKFVEETPEERMARMQRLS